MNQVIPDEVAPPVAYRRLYKNHGKSVGYWEGWVEGWAQDAKVILQYARTLDGKVTRREYQAQAKNVGRSNMTTCLEQAQLELDSRTNKQLDKGYVERQEDATTPSTNTLGLEKPMLAQPLEKVKPTDIDWDQAYIQPKLDGHRAIWKDGMFYSRQGKRLHLPYIEDELRMYGLDDLHLDGEIYIHGKTLQEISSLIKRNQEGSDALVFHIYDIVDPRPYQERHREIWLRFMELDEAPPTLDLVQTLKVSTFEELQRHHEGHLTAGYEGTMLRWGNQGYQDGKRSKHLLKMKNFSDAEFEIIGVEEGKPYVAPHGTYRVPVWLCQAPYGQTFTVTGQGDMHEKHALWESRDQHIGKQLTVKYHYLSKLGIPQLPVALRFRDDI